MKSSTLLAVQRGRNKAVVFEGGMASLRRIKDNVDEVRSFCLCDFDEAVFEDVVRNLFGKMNIVWKLLSVF